MLPSETSIAPENSWLEYYFPIGFRPIFRGKLLVLGRIQVDAIIVVNVIFRCNKHHEMMDEIGRIGAELCVILHRKSPSHILETTKFL